MCLIELTEWIRETMAKYLRYYDEFLSRDNHVVRVEILQEADVPFVPEELDANESLTIEWAETDKITPIQGSTATLVINCATDRQFIDLGTIVSADAVRLDIYRDGALYWSGCMDSEIYDEPYSSGKNYAVTLIFSDFGVLNRVKWSRTSLESFNTILDAALAASGINYTNLIRNISTTDSYSMALDFDNDVKLLNENFYNEEGEPMTAFEVLEGILQPFALRIIQRAGNIYIYDLNSLYSQDSTEIEWTDTDAHFSKDMVYNDATVRFSPYADDQAVDGNVKVKRVDGNGLMIKTSYEGAVDRVLDGFILRRGSYVTAEGLTLEPGVEYFDIDAQYSGSDAQGVLWGYKQGERALEDGNIVQVLNAPCSAVDANLSFIGTKMFTTQCKWLNEVSVVNGVRDKFKLRINLDFLFDVRYNPFEEAGDYNEKDNFKLMSKCRFVYVPVMVTLRDANGTALYHLDNRSLIASSNLQSSSGRTRWQPGEGTPLSSIANFLNGLACQKFLPKNDIEKLPVLKIKELREGITENSDWATTDVEPEYIVKNGDVIFAWSASLMVKIWNGQDCILNQHLFKVTSDDYPKWFYFLWCKYHLDEFIAIAASHATTMGHIKRRDLDEAIVLVPSTNELEEMNSIADPLINKIIENNKQIRSLTALRNTLLPKLMSGEVRVEI